MGLWTDEEVGGFPGPTSRPDIGLLLILGFLAMLTLTTRLPINGTLVVFGQVTVGPAVVTVADVYLALLAVGLVVYEQEVWIPRSNVVALLVGFLGVMILSMLVNRVHVAAVIEVFQWTEMLVLVILFGVLLRSEWQRRRVLWALVYLGIARAVWTVVYYLLYGYPGRRFDAYIEGAALVVLVGLLFVGRDRIWNHLALVPLVAAVLISQERKVWIGLVFAAAVLCSLYLVKHRDDSVVLRRFALATVGAVLLTTTILFLAPQEIVDRVYTLVSLIPGVGSTREFERAYLLVTGLEMFAHNPILGVGPENWFQAKEIHGTNQLVSFEQQTDSDLGPHNLPLKVLAETGVLGFGLFVLLLVQPIRFLGRYLRSNCHLCLGLLGLFVYVLVTATLRSGGFIVRAYLFITLGFHVSYELSNRNMQELISSEDS